MSTTDNTTYTYTATYLCINVMADSDRSTTSTKEPRPNNPEQAEKFREETNKAFLTFIDELQSFDQYKVEAAFKYFVHKYLNELLKMDNAYDKNASIYPVLETSMTNSAKSCLNWTRNRFNRPHSRPNPQMTLKMGRNSYTN